MPKIQAALLRQASTVIADLVKEHKLKVVQRSTISAAQGDTAGPEFICD